MINTAIIFSVEANIEEYKYEYMAALLANSIKSVMPEIKMYCGIFTNRLPDINLIETLERLGVTVIKDIQFNVEPDSVNYFLRNYTKYYFSNIYNLLDEYEKIIYLDIDVLLLRPLQINKLDGYQYAEKVPSCIKKFEEKYTGLVHHNLIYNWFDVIGNENKHIYELDYEAIGICKQSDIEISKRIFKSKLELIEMTDSAYYPKRALTLETQLFHYDGFIDSGYFEKLRDTHMAEYRKYKLMATEVFGMKITNEENYWENYDNNRA